MSEPTEAARKAAPQPNIDELAEAILQLIEVGMMPRKLRLGLIVRRDGETCTIKERMKEMLYGALDKWASAQVREAVRATWEEVIDLTPRSSLFLNLRERFEGRAKAAALRREEK